MIEFSILNFVSQFSINYNRKTSYIFLLNIYYLFLLVSVKSTTDSLYKPAPSILMTSSTSGSVAISIMGNCQIPSVMHSIFSVISDLGKKKRL